MTERTGAGGPLEVVGRYLVGALGVATLVAGSLGGVHAVQGARDTRDTDNWASEHAQYDIFECVRTQIDQAVPVGATVYIGDQAGSPDPSLWSQRLPEMTFPRATIVPAGHRADLSLTIVAAAPGEPSCSGMRLVTQPG